MKIFQQNDQKSSPPAVLRTVAKTMHARVLRDIEGSAIISKRNKNKEAADTPCFDRDELRLGCLLGNGGFSEIYE
eukprot:CAMPEP_0116865254 /NCGR_PEP_ID=MMETSP0418-20121206/25307_1 /TAXON_ID=1158023 /ORGANISM="Astrosyne radiata, Strain 13vi08-1A" /LENGTH=74 /DNA_ID=CAMNT_0004500629 /DNA_START=51 /DNA_END=272 /DNA_ORIENTATION=-